MTHRSLDPARDLGGVAALLSRRRAQGGQFHPGGIQWWLRDLSRDRFEAFVWPGADAQPSGFVMLDGGLALVESDEAAGGPSRLELIAWAETHLAAAGSDSIAVPLVRSDPLVSVLAARGYTEGAFELELMTDISAEPSRPQLPDGYRFGSLNDIGDDAFIDMHRAAWSDARPSPYRRELHETVKRMPDFDPDLVTVALAPDGTPAAYCIGWADEGSRTLEIEPLGTHRDHRRLGLARAVVHEVTHRAWQRGLEHVLVWNEPKRNDAALRLYTSAGMSPRREIVHVTKSLA